MSKGQTVVKVSKDDWKDWQVNFKDTTPSVTTKDIFKLGLLTAKGIKVGGNFTFGSKNWSKMFNKK